MQSDPALRYFCNFVNFEYKRRYDYSHEAYKTSDYHYEPFYESLESE